MSDWFVDRFPDRPSTPDDWRLSEIALEHDGRVTEGGEDFPVIINEIVDYDTLLYFARNRLDTAFDIADMSDWICLMFLTAYIDAFMKGAEFVHRGGHRD